MIHSILKKFRVFFLFLSLSPLWLSATMIPIDPCHDPLEIAALFSNQQQPQNTLASQIEKKEQLLEKHKEGLKMLKKGFDDDSGVESYTRDLANSLDTDDLDLRQRCHATAGSDVIKAWASRGTRGAECKFSIPDPADTTKKIEQIGTLQKKKERKRKVAEELASYMEEPKDDWGCEDRDEDEDENYLNNCRKWQAESDNDELDARYFDKAGTIYKAFCADYADNPSDCQQALDDLKDIYEQIQQRKDLMAQLKSDIRSLRSQQHDKEMKELSGEADEEQQAGEPCWKCWEDQRDMNKPSWGEIAGNTLTTGLGVALSVLGVREGRRAQTKANEMLALQGHPAQNHAGYSFAGASFGFPLIQNGIAGLTQANASRGGFGCSQTASHHASMNPMMQQQMMQQQMMMQQQWGANNPYGMAGNPLAQFQMNNPFANAYGMGNPLAQFQMNNPFANAYGMGNPLAQFQMNNPFANAYGMGNPLAQFQVNNPFANAYGMAGNPLAQFQVNNPFAMASGNPMMTNMNPMYSTQHSQQAMQQMQMRMQIQQAYMAQQQSVMQEQMQRGQVIGGLMQEMQKIQAQIRLVASGGVTSLAGSGSLSAGLSIGGITGNSSFTGGVGGPQHNPTPAPAATPSGGDLPTRYVR